MKNDDFDFVFDSMKEDLKKAIRNGALKVFISDAVKARMGDLTGPELMKIQRFYDETKANG